MELIYRLFGSSFIPLRLREIVVFLKVVPDNSRCLFVDWSSLNATLDLAAQLATVEAVAGEIAPASSYETLNRNVTAYNTVIRPRLRIS